MTNIFIMIFFGVALVIGVYFTWILLRNEMAGRPKPPAGHLRLRLRTASA